jgi:aspartokinase-like uncharacterized kinase
MSGPVTVVVKVGGSLLDWEELPTRLAGLLAALAADGERPLVLVGGGRAVDAIRALDLARGLDPQHAHDLALEAMRQNAWLLRARLPGLLSLVRTPQEAASARRIPLADPVALIGTLELGETRLPRTWDLTSDGLAAWLAQRLGAEGVLLLKSRDPSPAATPDDAARLGWVDPLFPGLARGLARVAAFDLRDPSAAPVAWRGRPFAVPRRQAGRGEHPLG